MTVSRRSLLGFLAAAPFIVRCGSLMPVRSFAAGEVCTVDSDLIDVLINYEPRGIVELVARLHGFDYLAFGGKRYKVRAAADGALPTITLSEYVASANIPL
jgi:hypothetical protein